MGDKNFGLKKQLLTYCTGGIRCEKGARWMQEAMAGASNNGERHIYTLQGGIVAYLAWVKNEIEAGRKVREDCLFKGKNYVFDARGSIGMGLAEEQSNPVAVCQGCSTPEDRLSKCKNQRCHLVLVICEGCDDAGGVSCCEDCGATPAIAKGVCQCEKTREGLLWDGAGAKLWNKRRKREKLC
jgi:predicted sulfurtransferase